MECTYRPLNRFPRFVNALTWIALVSGLLFAGCTSVSRAVKSKSPSTLGAQIAEIDGRLDAQVGAAYVLERQPIYALLAQRIGYTSFDIAKAENRRRVRLADKCFKSDGWVLPRAALEGIAGGGLPGSTPVDEAKARIAQTDAVKGGGLPSQSELVHCLPEFDLQGPLTSLDELVQNAIIEVSNSIKADPRYVQANTLVEKCKAAAPPGDKTSEYSVITTRIAQIEAGYASGALTAIAAQKALDDLVSRARKIVWELTPGCDTQLMSVERSLVNEYQLKYLDAHPGFVDGIAEKYKPIVADIISEP